MNDCITSCETLRKYHILQSRGVSRKVVRGELKPCAEGPHPLYIAHAHITSVMLCIIHIAQLKAL